jgi:protein phosphatase
VVLFRLETADEAAGAEGETLIGPAAAAAGLSVEAVRTGASSSGGAAAEAPPRPPRRRSRRPAPATPAPKRSWPRRLLKAAVALLVVVAVAFAAVLGARQVWFIGTEQSRGEDRLALFRGLPYELPFGIELFSAQESTDVPLAALPQSRREVATNHELRSEDDARSLLEDLEGAAVTAPPRDGDGGKGQGSGGGANDRGGGGGGGGGSTGSGGGGGGSGGGAG